VTDSNPPPFASGYVQLVQNYHGRVGATDTPSHNPNYRGNFNVTYVTGSHQFKTGFDLNGATRWTARNVTSTLRAADTPTVSRRTSDAWRSRANAASSRLRM